MGGTPLPRMGIGAVISRIKIAPGPLYPCRDFALPVRKATKSAIP